MSQILKTIFLGAFFFLCIFNLTDFATTSLVVSNAGTQAEANPSARHAFENGMFATISYNFFKLVIYPFLIVFLYLIAQYLNNLYKEKGNKAHWMYGTNLFLFNFLLGMLIFSIIFSASKLAAASINNILVAGSINLLSYMR